jgi:hypothetical protein
MGEWRTYTTATAERSTATTSSSRSSVLLVLDLVIRPKSKSKAAHDNRLAHSLSVGVHDEQQGMERVVVVRGKGRE